uniref:Cadherin domain-containing protein n=1 Tax=Plectus sambesii TaxID=2011161 RepID=A0A914WNI4_9BILA
MQDSIFQVTPVLDMTVTLHDLAIDGPENKVAEQIKVHIVPAGEQKVDHMSSANSTTPSQQPQEDTTQEEPLDHDAADAPVKTEPGAPIFQFTSPTASVKENFPTGVPLPFDPALKVVPQGAGGTIHLKIVSTNKRIVDSFMLTPPTIDGEGEFDLVLSNPAILDLEAVNSLGPMFTIEIEARDDTTKAVNRQNLTITVSDANEFKPVFDAPSYSFAIPESFSSSELIASVAAMDKDFGYYGIENVDFTLFGVYAKVFKLSSPQKGKAEIRARRCSPALNCRQFHAVPDKFMLILRARDANGTGLYSDVPLQMEILRENLESPQFESDHYEASLVEKSTDFEPLLKVEAMDPDNSTISYSLDDPTALFGIDNSTGVVFVRHADFVTVENLGQRFNITAIASDGANEPARVNITLDIVEEGQANNLKPTFERPTYAFAVSPGQRDVGEVSASDPEGVVMYHLAQGGAGYFSVNVSSGEIYYNGPLVQDASNHTLTIIAVDTGRPPKVATTNVQVLIAGLGSAPAMITSWKSVSTKIMRDAPVGTPLAVFEAKDGDVNAKLVFSVASVYAFDELGNRISDSLRLQNFFAFGDAGVNNGTLLLAQTIGDQELLSLHATISVADVNHVSEPADQAFLVVYIEATDMKPPPVDQVLQFSKVLRELSVPEVLPIGSYIYTVNVQPLPSALNRVAGSVTYTLVEGRRFFVIDEVTGVITTIKPLNGAGVVNVTVMGTHTESGKSATTSFLVNCMRQNDNSPQFNKTFYEISIMENKPAGSKVAMITAADLDEDQLRYNISGTHATQFTVNDMGVISTAASFDRETIEELEIVLEARDSGDRYAQVPVKVIVKDANDNAPIFLEKSYHSEVMENSPIGSHVLQVRAEDEDVGVNGQINYSLMMNAESQKLAHVLEMGASDGIVRNTRPLTGMDGDYQFAAIAKDGLGLNASVSIFLKIFATSRCQPKFSPPVQHIYNVTEGMPKGELIATFQAMTSGNNCDVTYVIWNGSAHSYTDGTEQVVLDATTGELRSKIMFDYENGGSYGLVIAAQSGNLFAQSSIEIRVIDVNDNLPTFSVAHYHWQVAEDAPVGKVLGRLQATDGDSGDFGKIYFHLIPVDAEADSSNFEVGSEDGRFKISQLLDREQVDAYRFYVLASNEQTIEEKDVEMVRSNPDRQDVAEIVITVTDVNDNGPMFDQEVYMVAVDMDANVGTVLLTVHAEDPDLSNDAAVLYHVHEEVYRYRGHSREVDGYITVDEHSGHVTVNQPIADFSQGVFEVTIKSADFSNESEAQSAMTAIKVWVYDSKQLVLIVVNERPTMIDARRVRQITDHLSTIVGAQVVTKDVKYHALPDGRPATDRVDVRCLFVNKTNDDIIPVHKVISIVDKHGLNISGDLPVLAIREITAGSYSAQDGDEALMTPAGIALLVFGVVLFFGLVLFAFLLCYYRAAFRRQKKSFEQQRIAMSNANKVHRYKQPPPYLTPPSTLREIEPPPGAKTPYDVQELSVSLGSGDAFAGAPLRSTLMPSQHPSSPPRMNEFSPSDLNQFARGQNPPGSQMSQDSGWYDSTGH